MPNPREPFEPNEMYHVYNHANGEDVLFRVVDNYHYFLRRYAHYIAPIADTYAYCLMHFHAGPNHFHLMVRIKDGEALGNFFKEKKVKTEEDLAGFENLPGLVSQQLSHFFNAYTKAFNKKYQRNGRLFRDSVNRKPITSEDYYAWLVYYIHANPVRHGFVKRIDDWPHSSYHAFLQDKPTRLLRDEVLVWFGGKEAFIQFHQVNHDDSDSPSDMFKPFDLP